MSKIIITICISLTHKLIESKIDFWYNFLLNLIYTAKMKNMPWLSSSPFIIIPSNFPNRTQKRAASVWMNIGFQQAIYASLSGECHFLLTIYDDDIKQLITTYCLQLYSFHPQTDKLHHKRCSFNTNKLSNLKRKICS